MLERAYNRILQAVVMNKKLLTVTLFLLVLLMLTNEVNAENCNKNFFNGPGLTSTINAGSYHWLALGLYAKGNMTITNITKKSTTIATSCAIRKTDGTIVASAVYVGDICTLNANLNASTGYFLINNITNGQNQDYLSPASFPYISGDFNITNYTASSTDSDWASKWPPPGDDWQGGIIQINSTNSTNCGALNGTSINLYINNSISNLTKTYNPSIADNLTAFINTTGLWVALYRNGTLLNNGTNSVTNTNITGAGYWNVTALYNGNATYNASYSTLWLNVTRNVSSCTLSFNPASPIIYNVSFIPSCSCSQPEGSIKMFINGSDNTASNNTNLYLGAATYSLVCNATNTQNYTSATTSDNYMINQFNIMPGVFFNTTSLVTLTQPVNVMCNSTNATTLNIYKAGSLATNPYIEMSLVSGVYNFTCNTSNANYTNNQGFKILTVYPPSTPIPNISVVYDLAALTPNTQACSDNQTLKQFYQEPNVTRYINCTYGCDTNNNSCQSGPLVVGLIAIVCLGVLLIFLYFILRSSHGKNDVIKVFILLISWILIMPILLTTVVPYLNLSIALTSAIDLIIVVIFVVIPLKLFW